MASSSRAPRAHIPRHELDPDLTVWVEITGEDIESGHLTIHDPDYMTPRGDYRLMTLQEADHAADEFCCDCFTRCFTTPQS